MNQPLMEMSYAQIVAFLTKKYGVAKFDQKEFIQWEAFQYHVKQK